MNKLLKCITLLAAGSSAAIAQTTTVVEQWDFTDNSLVGMNGTPAGFFDSETAPTLNADQTGGAFDNTYTVNRSQGFSGNVFDPVLNINGGNTYTITLQFTLAAWDLSHTALSNGGTGSGFGIRLRNASDQNVMFLQVRAYKDSGGVEYLRLQGNYYNGTATGQFIQGGLARNGLTGSSPITVGLTFDLAGETYTFWIGDPQTDDGSAWVNRLAAYTGSAPGIGAQTITQCGWALNPFVGNGNATGDFVEIDQVVFSTTTSGGGEGFWGMFPIEPGGYVDTGAWLDLLWVDHAPWVYSFSLGKYIYVPQSSADAGTGWSYIP